MSAQSAHAWALARWRALLDQARAATSLPWSADDLVGFEYLTALGPDRVIVLCEQAIDRLTAHAPLLLTYWPGWICDGCPQDFSTEPIPDPLGSGTPWWPPMPWPCPEVRAWTAWWAEQYGDPYLLKRADIGIDSEAVTPNMAVAAALAAARGRIVIGPVFLDPGNIRLKATCRDCARWSFVAPGDHSGRWVTLDWLEGKIAEHIHSHAAPSTLKRELLHGCPTEVWDGPFLMRCALGKDVCSKHGPFERALRCTGLRYNGDRCRRPVDHGGDHD